jgi:two-component system, sensor histidine kinase and response regulator
MKKILIIEDEAIHREEIAEILKFKNFEVYSADNGKTGLIKAFSYIPDLILCDIMMPGMDGTEVLSRLRSNKGTSRIQFVFVTSLADKKEVRNGMLLGADDYLTKPFTISELLMTVSKCLDKAENLNNLVEEELDHLRHNILTQIPNEMRTPLHGIIGLGSFLTENLSILNSNDILEVGKTITESGITLLNTVNKYLVYVQLETNPAAFLTESQSKCSSSVITLTVSALAEKCNRYQDLDVSIEEMTLGISEYLFTIVVRELTDNAFKFSNQGTAVSVKLARQDKMAELTIHNRGIVFPDGTIDKIGAFMQFDNTRPELKGSGIGLAISKKIIKLFNGTLSIKSTAELGTTVTVTLPVH